MADDLLPENVTLADLLAEGKISKPPRYFRLALANMLRADDFGTVTLRIGRTGNGTWPMYVLEKDGGMIDRFDGQVHRSWLEQGIHHDENWSAAHTTAVELHALWQKVTLDA